MLQQRGVMEVILLFAAFLAEIAGTITGFGSSTLLLPVAVLFYPYPVALALVAVFHLFGSLARFAMFSRFLQPRILLLFGVPSVIFSVIGAALVGYAPESLLRLLLGVFLLVFVFFSVKLPALRLPARTQTALIGGALSGFVAGLVGAAGAMRSAFLTAFKLRKDAYLGTIAGIAVLADASRAVVYAREGFFPVDAVMTLLALLAVAIAGALVGRAFVGRLDEVAFRKTVLFALAVFGVYLIVRAW